MNPINKQTAIIMSNPTQETDLEKVRNKIFSLREKMEKLGDGKLSYKDFQRKKAYGIELDKTNKEWQKLKKEYRSPKVLSELFIDVAKEVLSKDTFSIILETAKDRLPK